MTGLMFIITMTTVLALIGFIIYLIPSYGVNLGDKPLKRSR